MLSGCQISCNGGFLPWALCLTLSGRKKNSIWKCLFGSLTSYRIQMSIVMKATIKFRAVACFCHFLHHTRELMSILSRVFRSLLVLTNKVGFSWQKLGGFYCCCDTWQQNNKQCGKWTILVLYCMGIIFLIVIASQRCKCAHQSQRQHIKWGLQGQYVFMHEKWKYNYIHLEITPLQVNGYDTGSCITSLSNSLKNCLGLLPKEMHLMAASFMHSVATISSTPAVTRSDDHPFL